MRSKPAPTLCPACDAALTAREAREGWCDSCGKRPPSAPLPRARGRGEAGSGVGAFVFWVLTALLLLFVAAAAIRGQLRTSLLAVKVCLLGALAVQSLRGYLAHKPSLPG